MATSRRRRKKQVQRKLMIVSLLSLLLIIFCVFAFSLMKNSSFGKDIDSPREETIAQTNNMILHRPNIVKMDVKLHKKLKAPAAPTFPSGSKYVALTFDDGPGWNSTQRILNVLAKYNAKATWFVLGSKAQQNPEMLKKIASAGHEVANHSYSHANLVNLSLEGALKEINSTQGVIQGIIGKTAAYLRPPYGSYNTAIANSAGIGIAMWNVDSLDWKLRNGVAAYNQVLSTLVSNPVILFHDIYEFSADAVEMLVPKLVEQGYTFVTYSQYRQIGG